MSLPVSNWIFVAQEMGGTQEHGLKKCIFQHQVIARNETQGDFICLAGLASSQAGIRQERPWFHSAVSSLLSEWL